MKSFVQYFYEAFSDLGKLSPEQLQKGQRLDPENGDNFQQVDGRVFHKAVTRIMINDDGRCAAGDVMCKKLRENLTIYELNDYKKMKCFLGRNNSSGFCIKDGDELVSVFSALGSAGKAAVKEAIKQGAKRLDCFAQQDGNGNILNVGLPKLYRMFGFEVDRNMTTGDDPSVPYTIVKGVSYFVNDRDEVELTNPKVVVFMVV
jgi:hypothetical protein